VSAGLGQLIRERNELLEALETGFQKHAADGIVTAEEQSEVRSLLASIVGLQEQVMKGVDRELQLSESLNEPRAVEAPQPRAPVESEAEPSPAPVAAEPPAPRVSPEGEAAPASPAAVEVQPPVVAEVSAEVDLRGLVPAASPVVVAPPARPPVGVAPPAGPSVVVAPPAPESAAPAAPPVVVAPPARPPVVVAPPARPSVVVEPGRQGPDVGLGHQPNLNPVADVSAQPDVDRRAAADVAGWLLVQPGSLGRHPSDMYSRLENLNPATRKAVLDLLGDR